MTRKYLITGAEGLLAGAFIRRLTEKGEDFLALDRADLDITNHEMVSRTCDSYRPDVIINCAAYTVVNQAEEEPDKAFDVNARGPKLLAREATKRNSLLVHFSTNHVLDGTKETGLYVEDDATSWLNRYGESKLAGENLIKEETDNFLIFRVSWLFGAGRKHFIYKLLQWAQNSDYVRVTYDEFASPTYTYTAADLTLTAIEKGLTGLYHLTSTGYCSRFEWARFTFETLGMSKFIRPVPMEVFKLSVRRPMFSAMSNERISIALGMGIPAWEEEVRAFLKEFPGGC